MIDKQVKGD